MQLTNVSTFRSTKKSCGISVEIAVTSAMAQIDNGMRKPGWYIYPALRHAPLSANGNVSIRMAIVDFGFASAGLLRR